MMITGSISAMKEYWSPALRRAMVIQPATTNFDYFYNVIYNYGTNLIASLIN